MQSTSIFMPKNTVKQAIYFAVLFISMVLLFLPQNLVGINIFDEGFIVSGAMLVNDGKLPYRDFLSMYGPGQYYVTATIFSIFGESLQFVRFLHVFILAALGMTIYMLSKQTSKETGRSLLLLLVYVCLVIFARPSVGYPAITATLFLLLSASEFGKWADTFRVNRLVLVSCMIGIASLFRWDFGVFGLLAFALSMMTAIMQERRNTDSPFPISLWICAAVGPAMLIMFVVYIPLLVIFSSPVQWYQEVPLFSLTEFAKWRNIDFVLPTLQDISALWELLKNSSAIAFDISILKLAASGMRSILKLVYLGMPIVLVISAIGTAAYIYLRHLVKPTERNRFLLIIYLAFLCLFLLNQIRIRPGLWQGFPAMAVSLPLIVLLWDYHKVIVIRNKPLNMTLKITGFLISAILFSVGTQSFRWALEDYIVFNTSRLSGIRIAPGMKSYIELVKYVQNNTKPGEPIYSGVQDHSRLFINDAMLYFLTKRPPADRFLELEPGIANTGKGQKEIIDAIRLKNVQMIVLSDILSNEPNNTSRSNGITILDEFIRTNYHYDRSFGNRMVFVKN